MNNTQDDEIREKSRERQKQVLDAAAQCFREEGFHGCSIARISKAAGMSPGHIYYHFANKEAIIEALVERQKNTLLDMMNDIAASQPGEELASVLTHHAESMVALHTDPEFIGLWLEMAAESARNPGVARLLHAANHITRTTFDEQLLARGGANTPEELLRLRAGMEILSAIFNGLSLAEPTRAEEDRVSKALLVETINSIIQQLFGRR